MDGSLFGSDNGKLNFKPKIQHEKKHIPSLSVCSMPQYDFCCIPSTFQACQWDRRRKCMWKKMKSENMEDKLYWKKKELTFQHWKAFFMSHIWDVVLLEWLCMISSDREFSLSSHGMGKGSLGIFFMNNR